jgi:pimeloyl-ACP methyl ester carboxylesterase
MSTFVCLHGAGGHAAYWDLVRAELAPDGHEVLGVDLPCDQPSRLADYVPPVLDVIGGRTDVVLVAQSLAGFVAPLVAAEVPVERMVLVAAMVPAPGENGGDWWSNVGHAAALEAQGLPEDADLFTQDVDPEVLARFPEPRAQTDDIFLDPWPLAAWPDVETRFVVCRDDRFFPAAWLTGLVRDRLGLEPVDIPGGHCAFLSQPAALAAAMR